MAKVRRQRVRKVARQEAQRRDAAARFRQPHTGKQAGKIASAQAGLEFNPVIRQMRGEARGSVRRERDIGNWYDTLASDYTTGAAQALEAYKASEAATTQRTQEAGARGVSALQELSAEDAKLAELVGGPKNSAGLSQMAAAQAAADRQRATLAQPNTEAGANAVAYLGRRSSSARLRGIEARQGERRARGRITSDLATARRERGRATVANMETLRAGDRDHVVQLRAFPMEKAKLAQDARQDAIGNRQEQERIKISRRNARTSERKSGGEDGGRTPSQERSDRQGARNAAAAVRRTVEANGVPKSKKEWAGLEALVAKEEEISPAEARRAVARYRKKAQRKSGKRVKTKGWGKPVIK